jgi:peptidoglycan/LPS O-acetylase OafA/YrhL
MARSYRTDIDGLRAIAILGVVIHHAGFSALGGGFAGVDVFFVISGYLIGGHIFEDLAAGRFSFKRFYLRRFRRIYPALVTVLLATLIAGWFIMLPHDYRYMGGAAFTALLSLSNVWFLQTIDYFHPEAAHDPLVHTWSLGVEEQFYLLVPLTLFLLWRWRPGWTGGFLLGLIGLSLGLALATSGEYRMEAFYLLHTRAWELFGGVLVAHIAHNRRPLPPRLGLLASTFGLGLIAAGLILVPPLAPWPGWWTLPAVLGTALVLLAGGRPQPITYLLSLPPLRFVGLISYSLYLWHQPVFSLLAQAQLWPVSTPGLLLVLAGLIALSTLSWRFVEQPFRRGASLPIGRRAVLTGAILGITALAIGGHITRGFPSRVPADVQAILAYDKSYAPSYRSCIYTRKQVPGLDLDQSCTFPSDTSHPPTVAIWGDSHAARLAEPLGVALGQHGLTLRQLTLSSCQPVPDLINIGQTRAAQCPAFNQQVLTYLAAHPEITDVVLFATWNNFLFARSGPDMHGNEKDDGFYSVPLNGAMPDTPAARHRAFGDALANTLSRLGATRDITLVLALPRPDISIPRHFAARLWRGADLPQTAGFARRHADALGQPAFALFSDAIARSGLPEGRVRLIDPATMFCTSDSCDLIRDGKLLYSDGNHPSLDGIALMLPALVDAIRN